MVLLFNKNCVHNPTCPLDGIPPALPMFHQLFSNDVRGSVTHVKEKVIG